jgi:hypothetical protein
MKVQRSQKKYKQSCDRLLMKNDENKNKWREYFDIMFNEKSEKIMIKLDDSFDDHQ